MQDDYLSHTDELPGLLSRSKSAKFAEGNSLRDDGIKGLMIRTSLKNRLTIARVGRNFK